MDMSSGTSGSVKIKEEPLNHGVLQEESSHDQERRDPLELYYFKGSPNCPNSTFGPLEPIIEKETNCAKQKNKPTALPSTSGEQRNLSEIEFIKMEPYSPDPLEPIIGEEEEVPNEVPLEIPKEIPNENDKPVTSLSTSGEKRTPWDFLTMDLECPAKKPRVQITLHQKLDAIRCLDNGQSVTQIAAHLRVTTAAVRKWRLNRVQMEQWCANAEKDMNLKKRITMKSTVNSDLGAAVFEWFCKMRERGTEISGPMIKRKALMLHKQMRGDGSFSASEGWLHRWKLRHGIGNLTVPGEKQTTESSPVEEFTATLSNVIDDKRLSRDQVFNCDETYINYKTLPPKRLATRRKEIDPEAKEHEEYITVMVCGNASGSLKLRPMVVGKSKNPRALRHMNMDRLPVFYRNTKTAWMTSELFKEWFDVEFIPKVTEFLEERGLPLNALLVIENTPSHPPEEELAHGDIQTIFIPPDVTASIQPMDQGIVESFKRNYRLNLINHIAEELSKGVDILQILQAVTMKDVVFWVAESWEKMTSSSIRKCWRKTWTAEDSGESGTEHGEATNERFMEVLREMDGYEDVKEDDVQLWIINDDAIELMSDKEILSAEEKDRSDDEDDEREDISTSEDKVLTHTEAVAALTRLVDYFERQDTSPDKLLFLREMRREAVKYEKDAIKKNTETAWNGLT